MINEIVYGVELVTNKTLRLQERNGCLKFDTQETYDSYNENNLYLAPGLVDLQINGFSGVDFNKHPITEESFMHLIKELAKLGVLTFYPTIITNSKETTLAILENINRLCLKNSIIDSFVGGIHLEGPFLSTDKEACGAHDPMFIQQPNWSLFKRFQDASGNRIRVITLAPEWENSPKFIQQCVLSGVIVSIGHTVATCGQIAEAVQAGARMSTHLGNGAPLFLNRNSNFIYEQLAQEQLVPSLITDGFHLPESFLKTVLKVKGNQIVLVSDSTQFSGMLPGIYDTHIGGKVKLEENGRLSVYETPELLAGSALSLLGCVEKLVQSGLSTLKDAWIFGSLNPTKLIQQSNRQIQEDRVLFRYVDGSIKIEDVFKAGKRFKI